MLVHRAVRGGEIALVAAGGDHKGIRQAQGADIALAVGGILNGHRPGLVLGVGAVDVHVTAQSGAAAGEGAAVEQDGGAVGGVALGDAAQIDGAALIQRDAAKFRTGGRAHSPPAAAVRRSPPERGRGLSEVMPHSSTSGAMVISKAPSVSWLCCSAHDSSCAPSSSQTAEPSRFRAGDLAGVHRAGREDSSVSTVRLGRPARHQRRRRWPRRSCRCPWRKQGQLGGPGAAGGERQGHQRGQDKAGKSFHSSRRPSSARMSVASSANSRWPPTGIP